MLQINQIPNYAHPSLIQLGLCTLVKMTNYVANKIIIKVISTTSLVGNTIKFKLVFTVIEVTTIEMHNLGLPLVYTTSFVIKDCPHMLSIKMDFCMLASHSHPLDHHNNVCRRASPSTTRIERKTMSVIEMSRLGTVSYSFIVIANYFDEIRNYWHDETSSRFVMKKRNAKNGNCIQIQIREDQLNKDLLLNI